MRTKQQKTTIGNFSSVNIGVQVKSPLGIPNLEIGLEQTTDSGFNQLIRVYGITPEDLNKLARLFLDTANEMTEIKEKQLLKEIDNLT